MAAVSQEDNLMPTDLADMKPLTNTTLGLVSGCMAEAIAYPIFVMKNNAQQGIPQSFNPRVIYQGLPMAMINLGGTTGVQFWFTGVFQNMFRTPEEKEHISNRTQMAAALAAGVASGLPNSMWELLIVQQQRFGLGILETPRGLINRFGVSSLFRGSICTLGREGISNLAMLGLTPIMAEWLHKNRSMGEDQALATGSIVASGVACVVTHPLDTIKTCMQGDVERKKYGSIRETFRTITKEHGMVEGLFKGFIHRVALVAISFYLINKFRAHLTPVALQVERAMEGKTTKKLTAAESPS